VETFEGRTAIVTGAASGIGRATAQLLAEQGAQLVLVDIQQDRLDAAVAELGALTAAVGVRADVADEADVARVFDVAAGRFGRVELLASNAGIIRVEPIADTSIDTWDLLMRVNARSAFLFLREFVRRAQAGGHGGAIALTSSIAGIKGSSGLGAYSMTKQAVTGLTRAAAVELGPLGIRVNAVAPGRIDTPLLDAIPGGPSSGIANRPIARAADPREVASLITWLLSDAASFVTGAVYPIDGGMSA